MFAEPDSASLKYGPQEDIGVQDGSVEGDKVFSDVARDVSPLGQNTERFSRWVDTESSEEASDMYPSSVIEATGAAESDLSIFTLIDILLLTSSESLWCKRHQEPPAYKSDFQLEWRSPIGSGTSYNNQSMKNKLPLDIMFISPVRTSI
jgi:hypothetical protein